MHVCERDETNVICITYAWFFNTLLHQIQSDSRGALEQQRKEHTRFHKDSCDCHNLLWANQECYMSGRERMTEGQGEKQLKRGKRYLACSWHHDTVLYSYTLGPLNKERFSDVPQYVCVCVREREREQNTSGYDTISTAHTNIFPSQ